MSLRDTLMAGLSLPFEDVEITVKENPVKIRVIALNGRRLKEHRAAIAKEQETAKTSGVPFEEDGFEQLWCNLFDPETGEQLFTAADTAFLRENIPVSDGMKLIEAIGRVNKTGIDLGKSSEPIQNGAVG